MKTLLVITGSFAAGVFFARVYWSEAIAKGKAEIAKIEAAIKAKFGIPPT